MVEQERRRRRPRTCWVRPKSDRRIAVGHYHQVMEELCLDDKESFYNFLRITPPMFDDLLERITPFIEKEDTNYRKALEPGMKLAITLRHLAKGYSYATLRYEFRVARNTICLLVKDVCDALVMEFKNEVITCPVDRGTDALECPTCLWSHGWGKASQDWNHVSQLHMLLFSRPNGHGRC